MQLSDLLIEFVGAIELSLEVGRSCQREDRLDDAKVVSELLIEIESQFKPVIGLPMISLPARELAGTQ